VADSNISEMASSNTSHIRTDMTTGIELYREVQAMKTDMNDRMDGCKAFWTFIVIATLSVAVFIVLSSGVGNG